jgi:hypothetical protein
MPLFHCPACDRIHDEPYEAAFGLFARCIDCGIEALRLAHPVLDVPGIRRAA